MRKKTALRLAEDAIAYMECARPEELSRAREVGPHTFRAIRAKKFLEQYCWVVYASGFKAEILEERFVQLSRAFKEFDIEALRRMRSVEPALKVFGNKRKADCFLRGAKQIIDEGFVKFKGRVKRRPEETLSELPGIGPITKYHLAKNIGVLDVAKPDIWLVRAAELCNAKSVEQMTQYQAAQLNESQHSIDVAIWMYAEAGLLFSGAR